MYFSNKKHRIEEGTKFCPNCGALQRNENPIIDNKVIYESRGGGKQSIRYGIGIVLWFLIAIGFFVLSNAHYQSHPVYSRIVSEDGTEETNYKYEGKIGGGEMYSDETKEIIRGIGVFSCVMGAFNIYLVNSMRKSSLLVFNDHIEGQGFGSGEQNHFWIFLKDLDSINLTKLFIVVSSKNHKYRLFASKKREAYEVIDRAKRNLIQ